MTVRVGHPPAQGRPTSQSHPRHAFRYGRSLSPPAPNSSGRLSSLETAADHSLRGPGPAFSTLTPLRCGRTPIDSHTAYEKCSSTEPNIGILERRGGSWFRKSGIGDAHPAFLGGWRSSRRCLPVDSTGAGLTAFVSCTSASDDPAAAVGVSGSDVATPGTMRCLPLLGDV